MLVVGLRKSAGAMPLQATLPGGRGAVSRRSRTLSALADSMVRIGRGVDLAPEHFRELLGGRGGWG